MAIADERPRRSATATGASTGGKQLKPAAAKKKKSTATSTLRAKVAAKKLPGKGKPSRKRAVDSDEETIDPMANAPQYTDEDTSNDSDSGSSDEEVDADQVDVHAIQRYSAKALRDLEKENRKLASEREAAVASATATMEAKNGEELATIDSIVKTHVWHKCKFITNDKTLKKVMKFVYDKLPSTHHSKTSKWTAQEVANYLHTYAWPMSTCLSNKRNYAQSQLRIAVIKYFQGKIDEFGRPSATPPAVGSPPMAIWKWEDMLKCATR